jgi:hypothetical protein
MFGPLSTGFEGFEVEAGLEEFFCGYQTCGRQVLKTESFSFKHEPSVIIYR